MIGVNKYQSITTIPLKLVKQSLKLVILNLCQMSQYQTQITSKYVQICTLIRNVNTVELTLLILPKIILNLSTGESNDPSIHPNKQHCFTSKGGDPIHKQSHTFRKSQHPSKLCFTHKLGGKYISPTNSDNKFSFNNMIINKKVNQDRKKNIVQNIIINL